MVAWGDDRWAGTVGGLKYVEMITVVLMVASGWSCVWLWRWSREVCNTGTWRPRRNSHQENKHHKFLVGLGARRWAASRGSSQCTIKSNENPTAECSKAHSAWPSTTLANTTSPEPHTNPPAHTSWSTSSVLVIDPQDEQILLDV